MADLTRHGDDPLGIIEALQRAVGEGWIGVGEVAERLAPEDLRLLREKPEPDVEVPSETLQRLISLVEIAEHRRGRDPEPWSEARAGGPRHILAPHGTVAHEVLSLRLLLIEFEPTDTLYLLDQLQECQDTQFEVITASRVGMRRRCSRTGPSTSPFSISRARPVAVPLCWRAPRSSPRAFR